MQVKTHGSMRKHNSKVTVSVLKVHWLQALICLQPRDLNILSAYDHITEDNQLVTTTHYQACQARQIYGPTKPRLESNSSKEKKNGTVKLHKKI